MPSLGASAGQTLNRDGIVRYFSLFNTRQFAIKIVVTPPDVCTTSTYLPSLVNRHVFDTLCMSNPKHHALRTQCGADVYVVDGVENCSPSSEPSLHLHGRTFSKSRIPFAPVRIFRYLHFSVVYFHRNNRGMAVLVEKRLKCSTLCEYGIYFRAQSRHKFLFDTISR